MDAKASIDALTRDFFNLFTSGQDGKADLSAITRLFIPEGLIVKSVGEVTQAYTLAQFVEPREKLLNDGTLLEFREEEISERTEIAGNIAQRLSVYKKSGILAGEHFESQGVKTLQFVKTPEGWRLSALAWDDERPGFSVLEWNRDR
ncbi:MAG: DUF4440 domain-containing protein [Candidatus Eremiobacteraeota bacterium]|nr:DUF4440 domain-containing protein [Candidatus Eremiobacteraeota bacterium]